MELAKRFIDCFDASPYCDNPKKSASKPGDPGQNNTEKMEIDDLLEGQMGQCRQGQGEQEKVEGEEKVVSYLEKLIKTNKIVELVKFFTEFHLNLQHN